MKMKGANTAVKVKTVDGKVEKPKGNKKLAKAEEAVAKFGEMKKDLLVMQQDFEKRFPQAHAELQSIKQHEDEVREQIEGCKILVRDAGQTVGEFAFTAKFTSECYDGGMLLELMSKLQSMDCGLLFKELFDRGFIKDLVIDRAASKVIRASDAELRDRLEPAWDKGGKPLTPAISTPKI